MANNSPITLYWDANVFIDYVQEMPERINDISSVIAEIRSIPGSRIYTSIFSTIEVAHVAYERERERLDAKAEERLDRMWADRSLITVVEMNPEVARTSRWIMRAGTSRSWSLKGKDAVHLGTAYWLSKNGIAINYMNTYDHKLYKYSEIINTAVCAPSPRQFSLNLSG